MYSSPHSLSEPLPSYRRICITDIGQSIHYYLHASASGLSLRDHQTRDQPAAKEHGACQLIRYRQPGSLASARLSHFLHNLSPVWRWWIVSGQRVIVPLPGMQRVYDAATVLMAGSTDQPQRLTSLSASPSCVTIPGCRRLGLRKPFALPDFRVH